MSVDGPLWSKMAARPRLEVPVLTRDQLPLDPGVYSFWRDGKPVYVGKATSLRSRVWKSHGGRGAVMTGSAFRRNVAEHLGIASANDIYKRIYQPTDQEVSRVRAFIEGCEAAWITCPTEPAAVDLETRMKREWTPPLTKR